jgi:hypothetical protein
MLSQESPTLTAHSPSFPTCLFHPRRVHLLCHLDSPSAASLPYLGLQEQTGPEVSGFCGSYRVPSKSSLLPLRTLSPGGSRSQANKSHADQHCVTTTVNREDRLGLLTQAQQWRQGLTVLILGTRDNNPRRELHRLPGSERVRSELDFQMNTIFSALRQRVYMDFAEQTQAFPPTRFRIARGLLQTSSHPPHSGPYPVEWRRRNPSHGSSQPFSACARVDTCHPWNCMRSTSTRSSHHLGNHVSFQKDLG